MSCLNYWCDKNELKESSIFQKLNENQTCYMNRTDEGETYFFMKWIDCMNEKLRLSSGKTDQEFKRLIVGGGIETASSFFFLVIP